jgi:hypothetical protein
MPRETLTPAEWGTITLDITTLTLGEAAAAEVASGMTIQELARGRATLRLLAMFVHGLRTYAEPPSWSELASLRALDVLPSTSRSPSAGRSPRSKV